MAGVLCTRFSDLTASSIAYLIYSTSWLATAVTYLLGRDYDRCVLCKTYII